MFTHRTSRAGGSGSRSFTRIGGVVAGAALIGGSVLVAPLAASAAEPVKSAAQGQFLSGSLLGANLDKIAALKAATAKNDGTEGTKEVKDPLALSVLGSTPIDLSGVGRVVPGNVLGASISGGVLSQYAKAENNGSAIGASGTVGAGGAIGPTVSDGTGGPLSVSFNSLINDKFAAVISNLRLEIQAVAAQAKGTPSGVSGSYYLDGLTLKFTSPTIKDLTTTVTSSLDPLNAEITKLTGPGGTLAVQLNNLLAGLNPALKILGSSAHVSATVTTDLNAAIAPLLTATYGGQGVTFNLQTGEVSVDLEKLIGSDLNNKPVGYNVLTGATVTRIINTIVSNVSTLGSQVTQHVDAALRNARIDLHADVALLTPQAPVLGQSCVNAGAGASAGTGSSGSGGLLGGLLGGVGGLLNNVGAGVGAVVCTPTSTLLPSLQTSANVDLHGTIRQVLDGSAPATVVAKVLGIPLSISTGQLLGSVGARLTDSLFDADGGLTLFSKTLPGSLTDKLNTGLLGSTSVDTLLSDLVSIKLNLQDTQIGGGGFAVPTGTTFTETALRVSVAPGAARGGLTTLNLAAASVAPNLGSSVVVPPTNPPGGNPDPSNPGNPGNPGNPITTQITTQITPTAAISGNLAFTGVGIATIIAVILALLAAGAYMVREGYRRSHPRVTG